MILNHTIAKYKHFFCFFLFVISEAEVLFRNVESIVFSEGSSSVMMIIDVMGGVVLQRSVTMQIITHDGTATGLYTIDYIIITSLTLYT